MVSLKSLVVEIVGDTESGKTHFVSNIPNSIMFDLTPTKESELIFLAVTSNIEENYVHCSQYEDISMKLKRLGNEIKSVVLDGSSYLSGLAEKRFLSLQKGNRQKAIPIEYGKINEMIREDILFPIIQYPRNLILTSSLRDEYVNDIKTGRKERKGVSSFDTMRDVGVFLYLDENKHRQNTIIKNRFIPRTIIENNEQTRNPDFITSMTPEASWNALISQVVCSSTSKFKKEYLIV